MKHGTKIERHGYGYESPEYRAWRSMRNRCLNPTNKSYKYYGGRDITICSRWGKFSNFLEDIGKRPSSGHSLDRIDNNGSYEPSNCRWANKLDQMNNQRSNHLITYHGKTQTLSQWAREIGIKRVTLSERIHRSKWPISKALGFTK